MISPTIQNLYRRQLAEGFSRLRFVPTLETAFREDHFLRRRRYTRTGMLIAAAFYTLYLLVAWLDTEGQIWNLPTLIRGLIIVSMLVGAQLIPVAPRPWFGFIVVATYVVLGGGITAVEIIASHQNSIHRYEGILLAVIHCCFFGGLLFRSCCLCVTLMLSNYVLAGWLFGLPLGTLGIQTFLCLLAAWMGLTAVFLTEGAERENFLNRQLLNISANYDELTGLASRAAFDRHLPQHLRQNALQGSGQQALILVDIDYFKQLNDSRGHDTGDKCLQLVADILAGSVDAGPTAVARWGGDELIAVTDAQALDKLEQQTESLRQGIEDLRMDNPGSPYQVLTVSIGVVVIPTALRLPEKLLFRQADAALYQAKKDGRNRVVMQHAQAPAQPQETAPASAHV